MLRNHWACWVKTFSSSSILGSKGRLGCSIGFFFLCTHFSFSLKPMHIIERVSEFSVRMCLYYISLVFFVCMSKALLSGTVRTSAWLCLLAPPRTSAWLCLRAPLASWVEKVKSKAPSPVRGVFDQELLSTFLTVGGQCPALWQPC